MSSNHRQILKSSAIVGGSSAIAMALGVVKVKVLALLLGPAGVGLMGIYQNIMGVASTLFGCGMGTSGVRQVAASSDPAHRALVRRALWWGSLSLGALGAIGMWAARETIARQVFGHTRHAADVGIAGIGVFFTLASASQTAILQGHLRIADLARVTVAGALGGTIAGILLAFLLGHAGIIWFVITAPLFSALAGAFYLRRVPASAVRAPGPEVRAQIRDLMRLGIPFMLSSLGTMATQLLARRMILQELGMEAAGYFQAAWQISMVYIGFVLQAMSLDYYPRLTAALAESPEKARALMADQTEMALWMGAPVLAGMIALAPVLIWVLYSRDFVPAVPQLAWQSLGNLFKMLSWPMAYSMLAASRGGTFILVDTLWNLSFLAVLHFGMDFWGLNAAGIGFFISYVFYTLILLPVAYRIAGYRMSGRMVKLAGLYFAVTAGILALTQMFPLPGMAAGVLISAFLAVHSFRCIDRVVGIRAWMAAKWKKPPAAPDDGG